MSAHEENRQARAEAETIAAYLSGHPDFFLQHGGLLANLSIPPVHGGRAISLHERQLEVLREKNRALELRLAELIRHGQENDAIIERVQSWTRRLLLETDDRALPDHVTEGLSSIFSVPQVALRLWRVRETFRDLPYAAEVGADIKGQVDDMSKPMCSVGQPLPARRWLPSEGADTRSMAMLPLRKGSDPASFGLLVFGSADAERFHSGMGTAYLERIAETASASLSRLIE